MTLSDLLVALSGNTNLFITLTDKTGVEMITFNAAGYESVESDLGARDVLKINLDSLNKVSIALEDATP